MSGCGPRLQQALSGAADGALGRDRATAINPAVFDAAALARCASWEQYACPGVPGHEPARSGQQFVSEVMDIIRAAAPDTGSYVNETDYHQADWPPSAAGDQTHLRLRQPVPRPPRRRQRDHRLLGRRTALPELPRLLRDAWPEARRKPNFELIAATPSRPARPGESAGGISPPALRTGRDSLPSSGPHSPACGERD
jgi:hypothetical protein